MRMLKHYVCKQRSPVSASSGTEWAAGLSLEPTRKVALPSFHKQFKPTQPPALPVPPQKPPLALGQQCLRTHAQQIQGRPELKLKAQLPFKQTSSPHQCTDALF